MGEDMKDILRRKQEIESALKRYGKKARLLAASKAAGVEPLRALLEAGHCLFGENRVQEAFSKWLSLKEEFPQTELHMIGPLQSNKIMDACRLFDVVQTLESEKMAEGFLRAAEKLGAIPRLLIQVNSGEEPQKHGVLPQELERLVKSCRAMGLRPEGLMGIPPQGADPAPHFAFLKSLAKRHALPRLSFGMSADYKIAAQMGADYVRVGRALFGEDIRETQRPSKGRP